MPWNKKPSSFVLTVEGAVVEDRNKILLQLLTEIVMRSPVDTGRFRQSHIVSFGVRDTSTGEAGGTAQGAIGRGTSAIAANSKNIYDVAYIQNSLPYAGKLERGSSFQAPEGIYGVAYNSAKIRLASRQ